MVIAFLTSLVTFLIFGSITSLVPNPFFTRMFPPTFLDFTFLTLTSLMLGTYVSLHFYHKEKVRSLGKCDYAAVGGTVSSFLAFSCPVCNLLLVSLFGATALLTYFQPLQPVLGFLGIIILGLAIFFKVRSIKRIK